MHRICSSGQSLVVTSLKHKTVNRRFALSPQCGKFCFKRILLKTKGLRRSTKSKTEFRNKACKST